MTWGGGEARTVPDSEVGLRTVDHSVSRAACVCEGDGDLPPPRPRPGGLRDRLAARRAWFQLQAAQFLRARAARDAPVSAVVRRLHRSGRGPCVARTERKLYKHDMACAVGARGGAAARFEWGAGARARLCACAADAPCHCIRTHALPPAGPMPKGRAVKKVSKRTQMTPGTPYVLERLQRNLDVERRFYERVAERGLLKSIRPEVCLRDTVPYYKLDDGTVGRQYDQKCDALMREIRCRVAVDVDREYRESELAARAGSDGPECGAGGRGSRCDLADDDGDCDVLQYKTSEAEAKLASSVACCGDREPGPPRGPCVTVAHAQLLTGGDCYYPSHPPHLLNPPHPLLIKATQVTQRDIIKSLERLVHPQGYNEKEKNLKKTTPAKEEKPKKTKSEILELKRQQQRNKRLQKLKKKKAKKRKKEAKMKKKVYCECNKIELRVIEARTQDSHKVCNQDTWDWKPEVDSCYPFAEPDNYDKFYLRNEEACVTQAMTHIPPPRVKNDMQLQTEFHLTPEEIKLLSNFTCTKRNRMEDEMDSKNKTKPSKKIEQNKQYECPSEMSCTCIPQNEKQGISQCLYKIREKQNMSQSSYKIKRRKPIPCKSKKLRKCKEFMLRDQANSIILTDKQLRKCKTKIPADLLQYQALHETIVHSVDTIESRSRPISYNRSNDMTNPAMSNESVSKILGDSIYKTTHVSLGVYLDSELKRSPMASRTAAIMSHSNSMLNDSYALKNMYTTGKKQRNQIHNKNRNTQGRTLNLSTACVLRRMGNIATSGSGAQIDKTKKTPKSNNLSTPHRQVANMPLHRHDGKTAPSEIPPLKMAIQKRILEETEVEFEVLKQRKQIVSSNLNESGARAAKMRNLQKIVQKSFSKNKPNTAEISVHPMLQVDAHDSLEFSVLQQLSQRMKTQFVRVGNKTHVPSREAIAIGPDDGDGGLDGDTYTQRRSPGYAYPSALTQVSGCDEPTEDSGSSASLPARGPRPRPPLAAAAPILPWRHRRW